MATEKKEVSIAGIIGSGTEWVIVGLAFVMSLISIGLYASISKGEINIGKEFVDISYFPSHMLVLVLFILMLVGAIVKCVISIKNGENWMVEIMACISLVTALIIGGYLARVTELSIWWFMIPIILIGLIYTPLLDAKTGQTIFFVIVVISSILGVSFSLGGVLTVITVTGIKLWLTIYFVVVTVSWITAAVVKN